MFQEYFGFRENPFSENHDINYFYLSSTNKQLYRDLLNDIYQRVDITLLLANLGVGKTAFLQQLIGIDPFQLRVMYFHDTGKWHGLVDYLCSEMRLATDSHDAKKKQQLLAEHLTEIQQQGIIPVLIVDNAQDLADDSLEYLLRLTGQQIEGKPLLQVILAAVPAFIARFSSPVLQAYEASISRQYQIKALTPAEVNEYIHFRMQQAGCDRKDLFSDSAIQMIADRSEGIPRFVNKLCGSALLLASLEEYQMVDEEVIDKATKYCFLSSDTPKNDELDDSSIPADEITPPPSYTHDSKEDSLDAGSVSKQSYPWSPQLVRFGGIVALALILLLAGILMLLKSDPEQLLEEKVDVATNVEQSRRDNKGASEQLLPKEQYQNKTQTLAVETINNQEVVTPKKQRTVSPKEVQSTVEAASKEKVINGFASPVRNNLTELPTEGAKIEVSPDKSSTQSSRSEAKKLGTQSEQNATSKPIELGKREQQAKSRALARLKLKQSNIEFGIKSFMAAAGTADNKTLELLLIGGIPPDIQEQTINLTALALAAANGHSRTVQLLLSQKASIDLRNFKGRTALMAAAGNGRAETVRILLNNGAKININDHDGWTALMFSAYRNHSETAHILLQQGANRHLKNSVGRTALQIAQNRGHQEIVGLLVGIN